jgi:5-methyltetrahydropteroyltriglutamate--homocysteine methyltransferase
MDRILTTHTGSLPRPEQLQQLLYAQEQGEPVDQTLFEEQCREAVKASVAQQTHTGIDIINDGEMSKISYTTYAKERLAGFEGIGGPPTAAGLQDALEFPEFFQTTFAAAMGPFARIQFPSCDGPISYIDSTRIERDITNLTNALPEVKPAHVFMNAASPGVIASFMRNQFYATHEEYLYAIADAMKTEYDAIYRAGFLLQLDCPDLSSPTAFLQAISDNEMQLRNLHIEVLNYATRDIPADQMRMHVCWGNYAGPHSHDVPLREIIQPLLRARPTTMVLEAANPRHEHEWQVFSEVKLPEEKQIVLGVLDTTTNFVEHPELIAQRIVRLANIVGREQVLAGTDCGFATFTGMHPVHPQIVWAKMKAMVEGARLASQQLW